MEVCYYAKGPGDDQKGALVLKRIEKLKKKEPRLYALVESTLKSVGKPEIKNLSHLEKTEVVSRLTGVREPLYEFRIPKRGSGGVVRLYFCHIGDSVVILNVEVKRGRGADNDCIREAIKRYRELYK